MNHGVFVGSIIFYYKPRPLSKRSLLSQRVNMALQVTYRYKNQVPDEAQRRLEGIKVKRKFTAKIPVSGDY